jgi:2,7-dihydroxy-5-methyl-1-naphthoate 7-O-methyltransferase
LNKELLSRNKSLFTAFTTSFIVHAAIKTNMLERIYEMVPTLDELKELYPNFAMLETFLIILEKLELIKYNGERYSLTDSGLLFTDRAVLSLKAPADFAMNEGVLSWMKLSDAILNGEIPFKLAFGKEPFEYFSDNEEAFGRFSNSMSQSTKRKSIYNIFQNIDFENVNTVLDVGCGDGRLLREIRNINNNFNLIGFDLPYVINNARRIEENKTLKFLEGSFFEDEIPSADIYILSRVLHDWNDEKSGVILQNIIKAMHKESRLLIIDKVLNNKEDNLDTLLSHLNVWIMCGGRERSYEEFKSLFEQQGLQISNFSVFENFGLFELTL